MKQGKDLYWDNLTRNYGNYSNGINNKDGWIKSDFKFEEFYVDMVVIDNRTQQEAKIINITSSSVEVYMTADRSYIRKKMKLNDFYDDVIEEKKKVKGINCSNWFTLDEFNKNTLDAMVIL